MRYLVWVLRLLVFVIVLLFALKNTEPVQVNFFAEHIIQDVPLIVVMLGAFIHTSDRDEAEQIALKVAEQTDLVKYLNTEARSLTVGGMKRLEVARALAIKPRILLLDEVMAGLNPTDIEKSIQMIRRIRDSGVSVLLIEHMMQATMALSDRIIVLNEGGVLVSGAPKDVVENPAVIEAYLGKEYQDA